MTLLTLELPAMYGDHHVVEVKRLLMDLDGVEEVYASSGFRAAEITYDAKKVTEKDIEETLDKSGYLGELFIPEEMDIPVNERAAAQDTYYRHTEAHAQTGSVVSFEQSVGHAGRALWPCPGMKAIVTSMDE